MAAWLRNENPASVDLEQVQAIDAAGLGLLVELHCQALNNSGDLTIANPSPCVRRLMALTNLESVLQCNEAAQFELACGCNGRAMTA